MKIKFYGVRGSYPRADKGFTKYGGNTPCVVVEDSENIIIFDAGTGLLNAGKDFLKREKLKDIVIFISHPHYDHIEGFPFFSLFFKRGIKIVVYGPKIGETGFKEIIDMYMNPFFIPFSINDFKNKKLIIESMTKEILINGAKIKYYKSDFHPLFGVYIYSYEFKGKKLVYATDINIKKEMGEDFLRFVKNTDILIVDSYFSEKEFDKMGKPIDSYGHSTFESVLKLKDTADIKNIYFFHYNPEYDDEYLDNLAIYYKREGVFFSKEGEEVLL